MERDIYKRSELYAAAQISLSSARDALRILGLLPLSNLASALDNEVRVRQKIEDEFNELRALTQKRTGDILTELKDSTSGEQSLVRCPRCSRFFPREPKHICMQVRG